MKYSGEGDRKEGGWRPLFGGARAAERRGGQRRTIGGAGWQREGFWRVLSARVCVNSSMGISGRFRAAAYDGGEARIGPTKEQSSVECEPGSGAVAMFSVCAVKHDFMRTPGGEGES